MTTSKMFLILAIAVATLVVPSQGHRAAKSSVPAGCTLADGKHGYCVQSYLCRGGSIVTEGDDLLDERSIECEAPKVCCALSEDIKEMTTKKPKSSTLVPGTPKVPLGPGEPCTAYDESRGRCLYPHLCRNDSTAIDGSDLVDERSIDPCPAWKGALQICCPESLLPPDIDDKPTSSSTTTSTTTTTTENPRKGKDDADKTCYTDNSEEGKCVPIYQCIDDGEDGSRVINVRYDGSGACTYTQKCCPEGRIDKTKTPVTPAPTKKCGKSNENGLVYQLFEGRTNEAKFGEFPWMVAVRTRTSPQGDNYNTSGGSLIHPSVVLTAAHFVVRAVNKDVRVRAGEWDTLITEEPLPHQEEQVRKIIPHPEFNNRNKHNDIALLIMETPFILASHIGVVCLPPAERVAPSTDCVSNGWGKDRFGSQGTLQNILKKTILPVVHRDDCQTSLRGTRLGPFYRLHDGFMCAGGERLDTCTQDGGGPLACTLEQEPDRYMVWGVVSWGIGCGRDGLPGVYVDVSRYVSWIRDSASAEGCDLEEYDL